MAWHHRLSNAFRRDRLDRDLDRELASHLAERAEQLRDEGMTDADALATARRQFGNLTLRKEETRDADVSQWADAALRNLRLGIRSLMRTRGLSAAVIVTLALGMGANSAVFSAIDAILLRPLPFPDGDQLVQLRHRNPKNPNLQIAPIRVEDWNRLNSTFQSITGYDTDDASETSGDLPEKLKRSFVAPRFLQVWGISPALGRDFTPEEEHVGGPSVILISDRLWRRRFGADPAAVGKRFHFGKESPTIVGILPASFLFQERDVDIWQPVAPDGPMSKVRYATWYSGVGRLKPGVSLGQARADLSAVQQHLGEQFPDTDAGLTVLIDPLKEETIHLVRRSLWIVFGSVSLLLLIACANIAALLLSRAIQRRPEISIRFALGATRGSIVAQLLTETGILAACGAALGLALAASAPPMFLWLAGSLLAWKRSAWIGASRCTRWCARWR